MGMKIYTANSARGYSCQIQRIEAGFIALGHEITPHAHEADLIYQNNAWFDQIIKDKQNGGFKKESKVILTVLDLCPHCVDFPIQKLKEQLIHADAICTISEHVKEDLKNKTGFNSVVIYQPKMPVYFDAGLKKHPYKYLVVGRANDANKRVAQALYALQILGVKEEEVGIIGGEYPGWGVMLGAVTDQYLNELYNSADFLLMPSKNEGIGLGAIEAAACKVIPVICADLSTREEFFPAYIFPEYETVQATPSSICMFIAKYLQDNNEMEDMKETMFEHYNMDLKEKFSGIEVAKKILKIYEAIK